MSRDGSERAGAPERRAVSGLVWLFALLWAGLSLARFHTVHNHTFDLAIYTHMAWGLPRGELWDPIVDGHFLAPHVPLVLAPFALLGLVLPLVPLLLCAQAFALSAAAWPLARFGRRYLGAGGGVLAAAVWLLHPNLGHVATYELHPGAFAMAPLGFALDAIDRGDRRALLAWSVLVLACRASLAPVVTCLGLLALLERDPARTALRRAGAWLVGGSAAYLALVLFVLVPRFGAAEEASLSLHYGVWGGSPLGVVPTLLRDPSAVLAHFGAPARLDYLPRVLAPLALLPLLSPRWLLVAAPTLALNLASSFPTSSELYSHYLTPAVPPLVVGALGGLDVIARRWPGGRRLATGALLFCTLATTWWAGGLPGARGFLPSDFQSDRHTLERRAALAAIPPGASVQAPDPLLPHLAERARVHRAPPPERETDFVVLDVTHRLRYAHQESLLRTLEEPETRRWLARGDHALVHAGRELLVLARGTPPRRGLARRYLVGTGEPWPHDHELTACLGLRDARFTDAGVELRLLARGPCHADIAVRLGTPPRPSRVDLLFDGLLSPAQLHAGDLVRSPHRLTKTQRAAIERDGLAVGILRDSGARVSPTDPYAVRVRVLVAPRNHQ